MHDIYLRTKEKIDEGLTKLNGQPLTADNACQYMNLAEALYYLVTASAMLDSGVGESRTGGNGNGNGMGMSNGLMHMPDIRYNYSGAGRMGMDGDGDGRYYESRGRMTPQRYYYSGHTGKEHMLEDLKAMRADADSDKERRRIDDLIEDLKDMK